METILGRTLLCFWALSLAACSEDYGSISSRELISGADISSPVKVPGNNGGYWWSYMDNCGSTVEPTSDISRPFRFDKGGFNGRAAHISYDILPEPANDTVGSSWRFRDSSGSYAYPTGGVGFSFKNRNAVLSIPKSKLGIRFWAKGTGASVTSGITVEFPTADTDVALVDDDFKTTCTCGVEAGKVCLPANGARETDDPKGVLHTCFANFFYPVRLSSDWKEYAVLFKDLKWADDGKDYLWVDRDRLQGRAEDTDDPIGWDRTKALKVQFAAYRPMPTEERAQGELWIDDVAWIVDDDHIESSGEIEE